MKKLEDMSIEELEAQNRVFMQQKEAIRAQQIEIKKVLNSKLIERQIRMWTDPLSPKQKAREISTLEDLLAISEEERVEETAAVRRTNPLFPRQKPVQAIALELLKQEV